MTNSEAESYLLRLEQGDRDALAPLMSFTYPALRRGVRDRIPRDWIEDCAQAVSLEVWKAAHEGRFRCEGVPQFFAFVVLIARRWAYKAARRGLREEQFPSVTDDDRQWDPPAPDPEGHAVEMPLLLDDLLNKALIESARTENARDLGLLKKLAFQYYYVDRLSQKEILVMLCGHAEALKLTVTEDNLNNWLSGGRVLKTVVSYLVEHRNVESAALLQHVLPRARVTQGEREVVHSYWRCGREIEDIAAERGCAPREVQKLLDNGVAAMVAAIKLQLHEGRRVGT